MIKRNFLLSLSAISDMNELDIKENIILEIAKGSETSFGKFYELHFRKVFQFARLYVKSDFICQEIASDVFMSIWHSRENLPEIENIPSYLYTITRNKAFNYLDKQSRIPEFDDEIPIGVFTEAASPEELIFVQELEKAINKAVNDLPERCKLVFLMAREGNLRYKDISRILSISEKTVQAQMITAIKKLGFELKKYLLLLL